MSRSAMLHPAAADRTFANGYLFKIPLGELGWFGTLLIALASGFLAFFASTFCAIFAILFYNAFTHGGVDFSLSYRRVGLPCGLMVLAFASIYLGRLWVVRIFRRS
jgi:hypothetical protein